MAQNINTNIPSLNAQRNLATSQMSLQQSLQRLSSGLRINSAKDDAAGLAISDRMTSQINGLNQAVRNANDGVSLAQTADSALASSANLLQRMRELSIQSANATNSDADRISIQSEVSQLQQELTRLGNTTTFNGQKILNGSQQNISFHIGADANQTIGVSIQDARATSLGTNVTLSNNVTNGLVKPTSYNRFASEGLNIGKAITAVSVGANAYGAQTLTVKDASGTTLDGGSISVAVNDQMNVVAQKLNRLEGVTATASTTAKLANWVAGTVAGTGFSVQINSGATQATLDISGSVDATKSQAQVFSALTTAINNSADLKAAGVTAGLDSSSNLIIRNNNGADIAVMFTLTGATGGVYDLYGSDSAATALAAQATTVSGVVGGQLNVNMANGYSISSSVDGTAGLGLFKSAASASVNVKETNVGIADVMNGDTTANQVGTYGLDIGKAIAGTVNATLAQSVKVFDSSGKQVGGTISVAINASAQTITGQLNALTGVNATASTQATMNFANATTAVFAFSLNTTALTVSGITATSTGAQVANATAQAINGNTTLVGKGFSANVDGAGNLIINNSLGADIAVDMTGSTASAATLTGTDASGTMLAANVAQQGVVSGSLKIGLSSGYTIQSSIAGTLTTGGLFAGSANTNATVHTNGVNVGDSVAAQTLKIQGAIGNASVEVAKNDAADVIANKINAQAAATGVNASAYTQAKLSNISAAGSVSFTLFGTNTAGVTVSGAVTGFGSTADLSGLANAINTASTKTGISASLTDNKASIILTQADGKNINVVNFNHSAAVQPFAANINGTDQSIQVRGLTQTADAATGSLSATTTAATTLHAGGVANYGNDSTVIGGTLSFNSKDNFNVSSSASGDTAALSGGKSSLFSGAAQTANTSGLETVTGVDVSTVAGANSAISVIDAALTQVNSIRATLGAVQNRMQSTISSLSAGVENLSAARSRIQDTDFASETASLTRSQILQQAGVAMLSQANQLPQMVLSLLK